MFTGIVEEAGVVENIRKTAAGIELVVRSRVCSRSLKPGLSLAVNGCCLTVVKMAPRPRLEKLLQFDLLRETWERTNLQFARAGSLVNLERPLRATGRLDGHFVTGHIDGVGKVAQLRRSGADLVLDIGAPPEIMRYIVSKGSVAVDGISLTVAAVDKKSFRVWIIPHTLAATALPQRKQGDAVNLETDILGKYVERFLLGGPGERIR
jgi:riboflavin synthase